MPETTIEWTTTRASDGTLLPGFTFNPWTGCQKVSHACDNCYAEGWAKRSGLVKWGPGEDRRRTSENYWRQPLKWNQIAKRDGVRRKVFCASLADVFDNAVPEEWRHDLFDLIPQTPHLDWLVLTKRPQNALKMIPREVWLALPHVWLGTTVENQEEADRRIPHLLAAPAAKRFLSCEPLLGPVHLNHPWLGWKCVVTGGRVGTEFTCGDCDPCIGAFGRQFVDWVIAGGESGPNARPMNPDWARSLRDQCVASGVPYFLKQWGAWCPVGQEQLGAMAPTFAKFERPGLEGCCFQRLGKRAGALLDGREWREMPE